MLGGVHIQGVEWVLSKVHIIAHCVSAAAGSWCLLAALLIAAYITLLC
jgi:hypothetical protein